MKIRIFLTFIIVVIGGSCSQENQRVIPSSNARVTGGGAATPQNDSGTNNGDQQAEVPADEVANEALGVTFQDNILPFMQESCINCHSAAGIASFLPLENADQVRVALGEDPDPASNGFLGRFADEANPHPAGADQAFRDNVIKMFNDWQNSGLL